MKYKAITGIMLTMLFIGMLKLAFDIQPVKASGTIYIKADGSIDPPTANITSVDNVTYTFTGNINDSIVVERDNIVVDGAGHTVQDTVSGNGIYLSGRSNVTIKNMKIEGFGDHGIYLYNSSNNSIERNTVGGTTGSSGIGIYSSANNTISGNNITNNFGGIYLGHSSNNSIYGNNITENDEYAMGLSNSSNNNIY